MTEQIYRYWEEDRRQKASSCHNNTCQYYCTDFAYNCEAGIGNISCAGFKSVNLKTPKSSPKDSTGKTPWEVFPWPEAEEVCRAFEYGAKKYGAPFTYRRGIAVVKLAAATIRHCVALLKGERIDPESGLFHAAHIAANGMMIISQSIVDLPEQK